MAFPASSYMILMAWRHTLRTIGLSFICCQDGEEEKFFGIEVRN